MPSFTELVNIFVTLLAIVDPMGAIPIFLGLTAGQSTAAHRRIAWISAATVAVVLIASALFGEPLLKFFGISIPSFRVAGGLLLLLIGINMLQAQKGFGRETRIKGQNTDRDGVAVVPLAVPLLSGPGAISTMTIYAHRSSSWAYLASLIGVSLLLALATWLLLHLAHPIGRRLGKTGLNITVRLMGLLLSAVSVQFMAEGIGQLFPGLFR